jgi:hypothetical protein
MLCYFRSIVLSDDNVLIAIERASDRPMKAAAMDAEAAKTLDPITHTGLSRSGAAAKCPLPTTKANQAYSIRFARSRTW